MPDCWRILHYKERFQMHVDTTRAAHVGRRKLCMCVMCSSTGSSKTEELPSNVSIKRMLATTVPQRWRVSPKTFPVQSTGLLNPESFLFFLGKKVRGIV